MTTPNSSNRTRMQHLRTTRLGRKAAVIAAMIASATVAACNPDELLEVVDPDIISPDQVTDSAGAEALRVGALARFNGATTGLALSGNEGIFILGATLADELRSSDTFVQRDEIDQRGITVTNANLNTAYRDAQRARLSAAQAKRALLQYAASRRPQAAEMLHVEAYIENLLAESFCSGIPFSDFVDGREILGEPQTTEAALNRALSHADSAIALATGTDAFATQVRTAAQITRGRILLNLGRFADAGTAVTAVPTAFTQAQEQSQTSRDNAAWSWINNQRRFTLVDREGTNGLPYISANDPRISAQARVAGGGFDAAVDLVRQGLYPTRETSVPLITGIEARLIEAEAALQANNPTRFIQLLNEPRTAGRTIGAITIAPGQLAPLTDPGTQAGRVDLLFRERAFWMFLTGHRLGDLRRLVRQYNRPANTVFPTGNWEAGTGVYGSDVNLPITQAEENNPNFKGCINRNP